RAAARHLPAADPRGAPSAGPTRTAGRAAAALGVGGAGEGGGAMSRWLLSILFGGAILAGCAGSRAAGPQGPSTAAPSSPHAEGSSPAAPGAASGKPGTGPVKPEPISNGDP